MSEANSAKRYETTLCYLYGEQGVLMLHRTKKENDINKDKYIGVGGHLEHGESPEECVLREVKEETGLLMTSFRLRGILTFVIDDIDEITFLYTCDAWEGELGGESGPAASSDAKALAPTACSSDAKALAPAASCDEGELVWIAPERIEELPIWPGDKIFFQLLSEREDVFSLKLTYIHDELTEAAVDGKKIDFVV
ncbi:MAG: 8-oxo-dGTP diphosphatase [Clostridiales bacterium]|nr:8-oxo-dGTP diphosphatase [Clostridiales bacterium]